MIDFTVLTDADVQTLLRSAGPSELSHFADVLSQTFQRYSTTDEAEHQPHRASVKRNDGQTSLFMPSTSPENIGVKIVGVPPPTPSPSSRQQGKPPTLEATMTVCNAAGRSVGVLNAGELTAFRTSLGAMLLLRHRKRVDNVVMFGSGKQAYWHLRLALILRGAEIRTITVINRSRSRADELVGALEKVSMPTRTLPTKNSDGQEDGESLISKYNIDVTVLTPDETSKVQSAVQNADTIHCAVPSTSPLFPAQWLLESTRRQEKGVYITAIGSYRLDMRELDPALLKHIVSGATESPRGDLPSDCRPKVAVIVVDSRTACFAEAGEIVAAGLKDDELVEIGELPSSLLLSPSAVDEKQKQLQAEEETQELTETQSWLETGTLVYKSVGFGAMDLCIATELLTLSREKKVGVQIENFSSSSSSFSFSSSSA